MRRHGISFALAEDGIAFTMTSRGMLGMGKPAVNFHDWTAEMHPAVGFLTLLVDNDAATVRDGCVFVAHETVACMSVAESGLLALPNRVPYSLRLEAKGAVSDPLFAVEASWLGGGGDTQIGLRRSGSILASVTERFLVAEPLFSLLEAVDSLNAIGPAVSGQILDERMVRFGRIKLILEDVTGDARADQYLSRLTIHHATGLAIGQAEGNPDSFVPVLFGDSPNQLASAEHEEVAVERRELLPAAHATKFRTVLFPKQGARSHYRLTEGVYAVVDAPVEAALRVVQKVNASDPATQAAFRADPRSYLTAEIEAAGGTGDIICGGAVVNGAMGYGERVLGVREWDGATFSFKIPVYHRWFPEHGEDAETYTIEVPGAAVPLTVRPAGVQDLRDAIERARAEGKQEVSVNGHAYPLSEEFEQAVRALVGHVSPQAGRRGAANDGGTKLLVLHAAENEEDLVFNARMRNPTGALSPMAGNAELLTEPKPHQIGAISWLKQAYRDGMPGVLLADDMGLGKTLAVLAFLAWLRGSGATVGRPILIVAPKKLLENWLDEVAKHLGPDGLGRPVLVYDQHIARLREKSAPKEGQIGRHTLDIGELRSADWVLTTYETLRDYQFSFGMVPFRAAVYDEAQKMKSMASLVNNAAKSQQPDFTILMTGTPVENSVMDLWTLLDVAWPGFLGLSGKDFAREYGKDTTPENLAGLKKQITEPHISDGRRKCEPVMLRRFKSDVLPGLPTKTDNPLRVGMSPEQVRAYDAVLADQRAHKVTALEALHGLRSAAFHPCLRMPAGPADHGPLIAASARFRALFSVLDGAARADERVLVFVDLREGQRVLAELIRHRYKLRCGPRLINGDTSTKALNQIKAEFQAGKGFDVLLLGPKSAGFGLTLTAANHVVHMNRWWNPAVEDQCSDRVYRLGQTKPVTIHLPIAIHPVLGDQSFDVVLDAMLARKRALSHNIVVPNVTTQADLMALLAASGGGAGLAAGARDIDLMGWEDFEDWAARQFTSAGYQANTTPHSHDGGADLILRPPPGARARPIICQCKHRSSAEDTVDETAVDDVLRAMTAYDALYPWLVSPRLMAVTNGRFTLQAASHASENGVVLIDGARIDGLAGIAQRLLGAH